MLSLFRDVFKEVNDRVYYQRDMITWRTQQLSTLPELEDYSEQNIRKHLEEKCNMFSLNENTSYGITDESICFTSLECLSKLCNASLVKNNEVIVLPSIFIPFQDLSNAFLNLSGGRRMVKFIINPLNLSLNHSFNAWSMYETS